LRADAAEQREYPGHGHRKRKNALHAGKFRSLADGGTLGFQPQNVNKLRFFSYLCRMMNAFERAIAGFTSWINLRCAWFLTNGCKQTLRSEA
jgi:hypothetical protein